MKTEIIKCVSLFTVDFRMKESLHWKMDSYLENWCQSATENCRKITSKLDKSSKMAAITQTITRMASTQVTCYSLSYVLFCLQGRTYRKTRFSMLLSGDLYTSYRKRIPIKNEKKWNAARHHDNKATSVAGLKTKNVVCKFRREFAGRKGVIFGSL